MLRKDEEADAWRVVEDLCAKHRLEPDVRSIVFCPQEFLKN